MAEYYITTNSKHTILLAQLCPDDKLTLEYIMSMYCQINNTSFEKIFSLLELIPTLEKPEFNINNLALNKYPVVSLENCTKNDIKELIKITKYLMLDNANISQILEILLYIDLNTDLLLKTDKSNLNMIYFSKIINMYFFETKLNRSANQVNRGELYELIASKSYDKIQYLVSFHKISSNIFDASHIPFLIDYQKSGFTFCGISPLIFAIKYMSKPDIKKMLLPDMLDKIIPVLDKENDKNIIYIHYLNILKKYSDEHICFNSYDSFYSAIHRKFGVKCAFRVLSHSKYNIEYIDLYYALYNALHDEFTEHIDYILNSGQLKFDELNINVLICLLSAYSSSNYGLFLKILNKCKKINDNNCIYNSVKYMISSIEKYDYIHKCASDIKKTFYKLIKN